MLGRAPQQPASVLSGGNHQNRPFSPYRHAPTNEDLLHAATRGRGLVIPEESEKALSTIEEKRSKAPSAAPSAASRHTKQPSVVSHARSKQPTVVTQHSQSPSKAPSKAKSPLSPAREADDLNADEARMVEDVLANNQHDATPRTSYYAASVLEPDVVNSHFHDNDLCVLLHQESDPNVHEVVKRALRKAIRQRVKKLGIKYDTEVRFIFNFFRLLCKFLADRPTYDRLSSSINGPIAIMIMSSARLGGKTMM